MHFKEFERLKKEEHALLGWSAKRELAKINYHIHTDAIKTWNDSKACSIMDEINV